MVGVWIKPKLSDRHPTRSLVLELFASSGDDQAKNG